MFPQHVIARKRDGQILTEAEIQAFVRGATDGSWEDYQLTAMLMAIYLNGMTADEVALYTRAMMNSGVVADLSNIPGVKVDKHSTGGVGDKVSLPLAAMVAACGVPVPMISGRGLGHSGGTLDKLESIPGFNVNLSLSAYRDQVARVGCALIGQTKELAPSDKKLYALRDVTATVECMPLICGSIMCKKLAEGIDGLVLDVKYGRGAFMKDLAQARELAGAMVDIGNKMGKGMRALITAMHEPLGRAVGNAVEVAESIACLRGEGPADLMEVTKALCSEMLQLGGVAADDADARARLQAVVDDGSALRKFQEIIEAQGGDPRVIDDPESVLPAASQQVPLLADHAGIVQDVDAMEVALAALRLGAGRARAQDAIDPAVGVTALVKIGEVVEKGQPLCIVHANDDDAWAEAEVRLRDGIKIGTTAAAPPALIADRIG
ncbi:thymidine phosphorylase [Synoicihabitans lomoniglobus]|uniref:thymidine phosphorylase n=1 Tax=Synoicihabitans lomoniglobus TaxID=2909285 RepID=A0AAF0CM88_9BACT|nr:thymidine phosphorylase [Opitutaceae bacterium LMO-M01]WED63783.1 thymidine phosphorylase [Opitutaceae bacterium LMO-M01]